jgi:hypothetical protein
MTTKISLANIEPSTRLPHANAAFNQANTAFQLANTASQTANTAASTGKAIAMSIVFG